ncbi:hypothetical protein YC2023_072396 [Brassica napus]
MPRIDRRTGLLRSASDQDASPAPIRFPPDNFKHSLTLFSKSFSSLPRGTCSLSVSRPYLALDGIYRPIGAAFPNNPTRRQHLVVRQGPGTTGLSPSLAPLSRELGPGLSLRTLLQTTIRTPKTSDFQAGLFPVRSPLLRESLLVSFPPLIDMLKLSGLDFGQPRAVTHGRSASVPYPREDGGTTICDTQADVPSARRLGAQLAFKDSMVHGILQFTPSIAFRYVLHRCESRDIRCRESYAYDPTKTEVLAKDEHITTESAGTVRNRPTESDVSSFSGRSVSRTANHPRRRDPNTSPDHSIGRSDGRGVLKATSADPWSASFMVETRTLFIFHKSKNFTSDYEIRMPPTACFEHSNFFKVTAPEARPGQLRPGAYRRQKRQADRTHRTSVAVRQRTQDVRGRPSAHAGHPCVSVCPSVHTGRPSVHTGRPWPSVSTRRTSVAVRVCPCVRQYTQDVRQYTQDVRQYTQDVRGRLSAHAGRPWLVRVCPCVRQYTQDVRQYTQDVRQYTQDVRDRPSAHAGRPWLSVCVRVSVSTHRTSVSTHRTSVSTHRTSVSTRRTSVAVRVCPCVRQYTQDVRQHTQDVRQHTQDVCGCPCGSVCPSVHTGRPSVHTGRPWPSVSTHRTSVAVRQHTQDVRQCTQDVRGRPSAHTGRPSAHAGHPWLSVCVRVSVSTHRTSVSTHRTSVSTHRTSVAVRQYRQDVRGRPSVHISARWLFMWTVRVILAHVSCLFSTHRTSVSTRRTSVPVHQHTQTVRGLPISTYISMLTTHISMLVLPMDCPCTDFGQLMHHVSTHISTLALPVD